MHSIHGQYHCIFKWIRGSKNSRLKVQLGKTEIHRKEVKFLGHIVTEHGETPNTNTVNINNNI